METHILAVGYSLIAMVIGFMGRKAYGIHKAKVNRSKNIVADIYAGIRCDLPNERIQSNYVFFNTFLSSMRHGYIVSLILKVFITLMSVLSIFLAFHIDPQYTYFATGIVAALFIWLFYTDWMFASEIASYPRFIE